MIASYFVYSDDGGELIDVLRCSSKLVILKHGIMNVVPKIILVTKLFGTRRLTYQFTCLSSVSKLKTPSTFVSVLDMSRR